ncbi:MAG: minD [Actinomycetia bacterium]|nr:minD [Actinomycetes bacterium]
MSYRILLGAGDPEFAAALRTQMRELPDIEIAGVEMTSSAVAGLAAEPGLDAVLIDERLGPLPARDLIRDIAMSQPHLAVVLVAQNPTAEVLTQAMDAGARGVVSRQPTLEELRTRVVAAAQWTRGMRRNRGDVPESPLLGSRGTLLAVCGAKGGTGATTLAVHLALAAARDGRRICLVDLDLQTGDIPSYLDIVHRRSIADLAGVAEEISAANLADALFVHPAGPHVLLAPAEGERAEEVTGSGARLILGSLRAHFDLIVVDCGAYLSEGSASAVELADKIVLTVTPDLPALRAAKRLVRMWGRLNLRKPDDVTAVVTRHSRKSEIQPEFAHKVLDLPVAETTIPAAFRALEEAANTGTPGAVTDVGYRRAVAKLLRELGLRESDSLDEQAGKGRSRRRDAGEAWVGFLGMVPLMVFVVLGIWQLFVTGMSATYAGHAANEGARQAAVTGDYKTIKTEALRRISGMWGDPKHASVTYPDDPKDPDYGYVRVDIKTPLVLPGVFGPWTVSARAKVVPEGAP